MVVSPQIAGLATIVGREAELDNLRADLLSSVCPAMLVLTGMGGVGKTSLARAYAQRHLGDYGVVWWVRAEDPSAIDAEFRALLEILLPPGEAAQVGNARTKAFDLLAQRDDQWLLVLDNVPDAEAAHGLLPAAGIGHVLITSRATGWPEQTIVQPLDTGAAVELLGARPGDTSAEALAIELGGLPLALAQAAGFVRAGGIDLATYLRMYRDRSAELHNVGRPADYPHTVATTWLLAIDRLSDRAGELLKLFAFYAPDAIPVQLLLGWTDDLVRHRAIGELCSYSLVTPAGPDAVTMHRLIQAVTRNQLDAHIYGWAEDARALITAALPHEPVTATSIATWNALRTHVHALLDHLPPNNVDTLAIRHHMAHWTGYAGDVARARDMLAELLPILEQLLGADHVLTLTCRHSLAFWSGYSGDPAGAREMLADLLPMRERVLGAEHPNTLTTRHNLAIWTGGTGDAAAARDLLADLLPIREQVLGATHPDTLTTRYSLATWTGEAGNAAEAQQLFAELLPIMAQVMGAEHPDTLAVRHGWPYWIQASGDTPAARDMLAELLPVVERVLGATHMHTLTARHNLATWIGETGDAASARDMLAELLPDQERVLGATHPGTMTTRRMLAYWTERARR